MCEKQPDRPTDTQIHRYTDTTHFHGECMCVSEASVTDRHIHIKRETRGGGGEKSERKRERALLIKLDVMVSTLNDIMFKTWSGLVIIE